MSVNQLMEILTDINLDKKRKISSRYLNKEYINQRSSQNGGSYLEEHQYSLSSEMISTKIQSIKNALSMMKQSPPSFKLGIFDDVQIHSEDLEHAKYEMFEFQQRQKKIKETFSESWIKSKFPIYTRIIGVIIKLITCCLSCGQNLLGPILYQWMADNLDLMADFFLGLLGNTKAYSRYTQLFMNVPILGPVFKILFKLFRTIFIDIGGPISGDIIPFISRTLYNLILSLRPYFNTIYRYYIVVKQIQSGETTTVYLTFLMSLIYMFFEKNIDSVPGMRLIRIPLLHHNLWLVFNEIIRFYKAGGSICQWCSGVSLIKNKNYGKGEYPKYRHQIATYDNQGQPILSEGQQLIKNYSAFNQNISNPRNQTDSSPRYLFGVNPESMGFNNSRNFFDFSNSPQKTVSSSSEKLPIPDNYPLDQDYIDYVKSINGGGKKKQLRQRHKTLKAKLKKKKNKKSFKKIKANIH